MNAIIPIPKIELSIRPATMDDLAFLDSLQKVHSKQLGYFPTKQFEGYIAMGGVLIAEEVRDQKSAISSDSPSLTSDLRPLTSVPVGYCISRDRYLKRDELGVIYQLCVAPGVQRGLIGASLVKEVFARSAYGCRLYCCWCAKDLEANHFWEAMGFVPIAFRAGSAKKARVHIFWQKRIVEGDDATKWWYPSQTNQGAIREDRLVFPIPPGVSWRDVEAVVVPGGESSKPQLTNHGSTQLTAGKEAPKEKREKVQTPAVVKAVGFRFLQFNPPEPAKVEKAKREKPKRVKAWNDPKFIAAARELRDRWMERVNDDPLLLASSGRYDVSRQLSGPESLRSAPAALLNAA
jgi:hypothetical protein